MAAEGAKEQRKSSAETSGEQTPSTRSKRASIIEDHFSIDKEKFALLGPKTWDENFQRDIHDWYNIISLIPLNILNCMNWSWPKLLGVVGGSVTVPEFWSGDYFEMFFWATFSYFVVDALWVIIMPICVKSPGVILQHHCSTLLYLMIPRFYPEYGWLMGACMCVEVNTWLIIARRVFNKNGKVAFTFNAQVAGGSMEVKLISVAFYVTWILIRLIIYPSLFVVVCFQYMERCERVGSFLNVLMVAPFLQLVFCGLNFKWSYDLLLSKMRSKGGAPSKGL